MRHGVEISIHALREESDDKRVCKGVILIISIHALREESDCGLRLNIGSLFDFNPRPPRGERRERIL